MSELQSMTAGIFMGAKSILPGVFFLEEQSQLKGAKGAGV